MPEGFLGRLAHDVEVKRQMVAVGVVAVIVTTIELVLFFWVITPAVVGNMRWLLRNPTPVMNHDPVVRDTLRTILATADAREVEHLRRSNQGVHLNAALIFALPVLCVVLLYGTSPALRASRQRDIWIDVAIVSAGIAAFEGLFYVFGRRWAYPDASELVTLVAESYTHAAGPSVVTSCNQCATNLQTQVERSPTVRYIRQLYEQMGAPGLTERAQDGTQRALEPARSQAAEVQQRREMLANLRLGDVLAGLGAPLSGPRVSAGGAP